METEARGHIVAMGEEAFDNYKEGTERPKLGDAILFKRYAGVSLKHKDDFYRLLRDDEIIAIIPPENVNDITVKFYSDYLAQQPQN